MSLATGSQRVDSTEAGGQDKPTDQTKVSMAYTSHDPKGQIVRMSRGPNRVRSQNRHQHVPSARVEDRLPGSRTLPRELPHQHPSQDLHANEATAENLRRTSPLHQHQHVQQRTPSGSPLLAVRKQLRSMARRLPRRSAHPLPQRSTRSHQNPQTPRLLPTQPKPLREHPGKVPRRTAQTNLPNHRKPRNAHADRAP
uniref:(northern house mosquito) hypothetical protein n=1 Tax=Culex pipiens TaxID=7175 RepID=A0A8D8CUU7_CULPI